MQRIILITALLSVYAHRSICSPSIAGNIKTYSLSGDTLMAADTPFCLVYNTDSSCIVRSFDYEKVLQLRNVYRSNHSYIELSVPALNRKYYIDKPYPVIEQVLNDCIAEQIIENGYFSAFGANNLLKKYKTEYHLLEEWEVPEQITGEIIRPKDWNISWKATKDNDSTIILADGRPVGYYILRNWYDYGLDKWAVLKKTEATYRYFIYNMDKQLLAEVRVADWWKTGVKILMPHNEEFTIRDLPKNVDFMTVVAKLILLKQEEHK